jgi:putative aminopeptidase FrvX
MPKRGYNDYIGTCTIGSLQKCEQFDEIVNKQQPKDVWIAFGIRGKERMAEMDTTREHDGSERIRKEEITDLLLHLLRIPSPTGYTDQILGEIEAFCRRFQIPVRRNHKGNCILTIPGRRQDIHRTLSAHVDTLGAMVKEILPNGRLKLSLIGGFRWNSIEGEYCRIHTMKGSTLTGTIVPRQASVHIFGREAEERKQDTMEVRIDAKVSSAEDTQALGVAVGDFVSFDARPEVTDTGFIKSRHLDDKASVAILLTVAKQLVQQSLQLPYTTHIIISRDEEVGFGGNTSITPETVEYLAVDMGAVGPGQTSSEFAVSICAADSSGPYHLGLRKKLVELAERYQIPYTVDIYPHYQSDASAAHRAGFDIQHGLIGPGIESSHSHERTHQDSLLATAQLLIKYLQAE